MSGTENQIETGADDDQPNDGGLRADLAAALKSAQTISDDEGSGIDQPLPEVEPEKLVSPEEAARLADKAEFGAKPVAKAVKADTPAEPEKPAADPGKPADKPADTPEEAAKAEPEKPAVLTESTVEALTEGLPDDRRTEITNRLAAATRVTDLFKGHEAEMQRHGATPETAVARFLQLNQFAQQQPDEYVAWVIKEVAGANGADVIQKAASLLGLKLVPEADTELGDDEFEDPRMKELAEENKRLKAQVQPAANFGPDTPQRAMARSIEQVRAETGAQIFDMLRPRIVQIAAEKHRATGLALTADDLRACVKTATDEARATFAPPAAQAQTPVSAAQQAPAVAGVDKSAAALAKAEAASKLLDGSGHGATRQPAEQETGSIADTIRRVMARG